MNDLLIGIQCIVSNEFKELKNMFPESIMNHPIKPIIHDFVVGLTPMDVFAELLRQDDAIVDYLQSIVDYIAEQDIDVQRASEARPYIADLILKYRELSNRMQRLAPDYCPTVKQYLGKHCPQTAGGAIVIHGTVADIYYQIDSKAQRTNQYIEAYSFSLEVLPSYLGGADAENYISRCIIAKLPANLSKSAKKKLVKEEIKRLFKTETKGFPRWIQAAQWPMGTDNLPMVFRKQVKHKAVTEHDDYVEYFFVDEQTGEERVIRQYW
jgi:hypothetical protein